MKRTVLLAAYRLDVLKTVPVSLQLAGLKLIVVETGLEAIRRARSELPDLVLLDPELPDIDGATVSGILQRLPSTAGIPIIVLRTVPSYELTEFGAEAAAPESGAPLLLQVAHVLKVCEQLEAARPIEPWFEPLPA